MIAGESPGAPTIVERARNLRSNLSVPEALLWTVLRGRAADGLKFRRQHPMGRYVLDFYCAEAKVAVEIDGESHLQGDQPRRDEIRDKWLVSEGVRVLRIPAAEVLRDVNETADGIVAFVRNLD
ncbi:MAG TPA: endonuclease domain-containing protein [Caulobacteraceae bacterium]